MSARDAKRRVIVVLEVEGWRLKDEVHELVENLLTADGEYSHVGIEVIEARWAE